MSNLDRVKGEGINFQITFAKGMGIQMDIYAFYKCLIY